jgi:hypothetical protein
MVMEPKRLVVKFVLLFMEYYLAERCISSGFERVVRSVPVGSENGTAFTTCL